MSSLEHAGTNGADDARPRFAFLDFDEYGSAICCEKWSEKRGLDESCLSTARLTCAAVRRSNKLGLRIDRLREFVAHEVINQIKRAHYWERIHPRMLFCDT